MLTLRKGGFPRGQRVEAVLYSLPRVGVVTDTPVIIRGSVYCLCSVHTVIGNDVLRCEFQHYKYRANNHAESANKKGKNPQTIASPHVEGVVTVDGGRLGAHSTVVHIWIYLVNLWVQV